MRRQVKVPIEYLVDAALPSPAARLTTISIDHLNIRFGEFEKAGPSVDTKLETDQKLLEAAAVPCARVVLQQFAKFCIVQADPGCPDSVRKSCGVGWAERFAKALDSYAQRRKLDLYAKAAEPATRENDSRC